MSDTSNNEGRDHITAVSNAANAVVLPPPAESVDMVNHPPHYRPLKGVDFDCIQVARDLTFNVGNAVKYVWRADRKNGRQDLEKARWYLKDAIEHADPVYSGPVDFQFHTNELLQVVALAQTDILRTGFFEAIRLRELPLALHAIDEMLAT